MKTIGLVLEYDGSAYVGWQRQINGPSVQAAVEEALDAAPRPAGPVDLVRAHRCRGSCPGHDRLLREPP